jgi:hypothetical protein
MDTKTVCRYDANGYYVSDLVLDDTDKSPSGAWNIPASCTDVEPEIKDGYKAKWTGTAWTQEAIPHDVLCYYADGLQYRTVKSDYAVGNGEVLFEQTPTIEELEKAFSTYTQATEKQIRQQLTAFVQGIIDTKAQEKNYDNGISCASYVMSTNDTFKDEAQKFIAWRDSVWSLGYAILDKAVKCEKYVDTWASYIPTTEELQAVLPVLDW